MTESRLIDHDGWVARLQPAEENRPGRLLVLLHGYTGDEESMWVIARKFPTNFWILTPRAPYPVDGGGYSWLPPGGGLHSTIADYLPVLESLLFWLDSLAEIQPAIKPFDLAGFSQGAAAAYAMAVTQPERINQTGWNGWFYAQGCRAILFF